MARILDKLPIINLWKWAAGDQYTIDDDSTVLTPELEASDRKTDEAYDNRFKKQPKKDNGGKGKTVDFKEETKVSKDRLNKEQTVKKQEKTSEQKENEQQEIVD